jgi:electron transfer flavoprotein beta subunit
VKIIVCLKQILDPKVSADDSQADPIGSEIAWTNVNFVTDAFCENALETALQLREQSGGEIIALVFGPENAEDTLRKALAMKADQAVLVVNDGRPHPDPLAVAQCLAAAIRKLGAFDLVMVGRKSADWSTGQTGGLLAELLGVPCVSFVDRIKVDDDYLLVKRQTDQGWEMLEARPPLVMTIANNEFNAPRAPEAADLAGAANHPITRWTLEEIGVDASEIRAGGSYYEVVDLELPAKDANCEFMTGDSLEEKVDGLARRIVEAIRTS